MKFKQIVTFILVSILTYSCADSTDKKKEAKQLDETTPEISEQVIYGDDGRKEIFEATAAQKLNAQSVVSLFKAENIIDQGTRVALKTEEFGAAYGLCSSEKFRSQKIGAFCSGALVGPDLILTAGHCVRTTSACANTRFVFGFNVPSSNGKQVEEVTKNEIYKCKSIVARQEVGNGADYAVIRLDRAVVGRKAVKLNRKPQPKKGDALVVMGHPAGLPLKVTVGGKIRSVTNSEYFVASLDTYGGNSGSPVFSDKTGLIEGILVRGETDFVLQGSCYASYKCSETGCRGEDVTRVSKVLPYVPEVK